MISSSKDCPFGHDFIQIQLQKYPIKTYLYTFDLKSCFPYSLIHFEPSKIHIPLVFHFGYGTL